MDEAGFVRSELVQDAVIRNLEIIGEASRNIETRCPAFAARHPDLPLSFACRCAMCWRTATSRWTWP